MPNQNIIRKTLLGNPYVWDADALAFIIAQSITSALEKTALNELVLGLKGDNTSSKNFWTQCAYLNTVSPTSLTVAKNAIKYITTQAATNIGTDATHSSDGVLFNGTTQGWDLNNNFSSIDISNLVLAFSRANTISVSGTPFGATGTGIAYSLYPRSAATSGFISGTLFGTQAGPGVYVGSNDGTYYTIHKDGIKLIPSAETARGSGVPSSNDCFFGCRNSSGVAANFVNEQVSLISVFDMGGTPWTNAEHQALATLIQTYNTNVA